MTISVAFHRSTRTQLIITEIASLREQEGTLIVLSDAFAIVHTNTDNLNNY